METEANLIYFMFFCLEVNAFKSFSSSKVMSVYFLCLGSKGFKIKKIRNLSLVVGENLCLHYLFSFKKPTA